MALIMSPRELSIGERTEIGVVQQRFRTSSLSPNSLGPTHRTMSA